MAKKLTMVSIKAGGTQIVEFVMGEEVNGKTFIDASVIDNILHRLNVKYEDCYSIS